MLEVKVCGLVRREDAVEAARAGADYLGVVLVDGSPRAREAEDVPGILGGLEVPRVVVLANMEAEDMARAGERAGAAVLQLHGNEPPESIGALRELGPWKIWKALRVRQEADLVQGLADFGGLVDGILLDAWDPSMLGGTGRVLPWDALRRHRRSFPAGVALILAGGLNPENVGDAAAALSPEVVDVSSGVESGPGKKDPARVRAFIQRAKPGAGRKGR